MALVAEVWLKLSQQVKATILEIIRAADCNKKDGFHVIVKPVLTVAGIMERHNLKPKQLENLRRELFELKLLDILFSYPDGPRYDIALNMLTTAR